MVSEFRLMRSESWFLMMPSPSFLTSLMNLT